MNQNEITCAELKKYYGIITSPTTPNESTRNCSPDYRNNKFNSVYPYFSGALNFYMKVRWGVNYTNMNTLDPPPLPLFNLTWLNHTERRLCSIGFFCGVHVLWLYYSGVGSYERSEKERSEKERSEKERSERGFKYFINDFIRFVSLDLEKELISRGWDGITNKTLFVRE